MQSNEVSSLLPDFNLHRQFVMLVDLDIIAGMKSYIMC